MIKETFFKFAQWFQPKHRLVYADELPKDVIDKTIYIIGNRKAPWLLAFICPCGCHDLIQLNLLRSANPQWRFKISKKKKISISPSVWRTTGCRSHFIIREGKIDWVLSYSV